MKAKDLMRVLSQYDGDMEVSVCVEDSGCGAYSEERKEIRSIMGLSVGVNSDGVSVYALIRCELYE